MPSRQIQAVVFDAYGTLVEITDKRRPYRRLLEQLSSGSAFRHAFAQTVMTEPMSIAMAAARIGVALPAEVLDQLNRDLDQELASIRPFKDVFGCLATLKHRGIKLAICSNLAEPYASPVQHLIPMTWDAIAWSFEVGAIKPQPEIYTSVCRQLGIPPNEVLMIGDSENEDYAGPLSCGMQAVRLRREQSSTDRCTISSLAELPDLLDLHLESGR